MKLKDASFLQLHIEKLILGAGGLFFVVVTLFYVVGDPNAAELGNNMVSPGEAAQVVRDEAEKLNIALQSQDKVLPVVPIKPYNRQFQVRSDLRPLTRSEFPMQIGSAGLGSKVIPDPTEQAPYVLPTPPLPQEVVARYDNFVLDKVDNDQMAAELIQMIGNQRPRDFNSISVSGVFDFEKWEQRLSEPEENSVPRSWVSKSRAITAISLERQELDPVTGQWGRRSADGFEAGAITAIKNLPNQLAVLHTLEREYTQEQAEQIIKFIKENQELIARPEFVPVKPPKEWVPPTTKQLTAEENYQLGKIHKSIISLEKTIRRLENSLEKLRGRTQGRSGAGPTRQNPRAQNRRTPGSRGPGALLGGGRGAGGRRATGSASAQQRDEQNMLNQLDMKREELAQKKQQRDEIRGIEPDQATDRRGGPDTKFGAMGPGMFMPGMPPLDKRAVGQRGQPTQQQPASELEQDNRITVWAHDLTVKQAGTYRYRLVVSVLNPLFRQSRVEIKQRDENFNRVALGPDEQERATMPWSKPVTVDPKFHFFLVKAKAQLRVATVEIWTIYNGQWQHQEFDVRPGDQIGGVMQLANPGQEPMQLDMRIGSLVVDLVSAGRTGQPGRAGGSRRVGGSGGSTRMLYLEPGAESLSVRSVEVDRDRPTRTRLQNDAALFEELATQARTE